MFLLSNPAGKKFSPPRGVFRSPYIPEKRKKVPGCLLEGLLGGLGGGLGSGSEIISP